jgi:hypothetical protein
MKLFMGRDPSKGLWREWAIQAYIIQNARREGYFIEGDQNSAKRSYGATARAKACGMQNGTTDIRLILPEGRVKWIEIKKHYNKLSPDQEKWHARAEELGHDVTTIFADTPAEGWQKFKELMK